MAKKLKLPFDPKAFLQVTVELYPAIRRIRLSSRRAKLRERCSKRIKNERAPFGALSI
jgi:hypothetical protein